MKSSHGYSTHFAKCIKTNASKLFKVLLHNLNHNFMNKIFKVKELLYDLRNMCSK